MHHEHDGHAQVGESEASRLYASGAGHIGGSHDAPTDGQGSGATVQILRSIDGRSAQLDRGAPFPALHYKKGRPIDHSILTACEPSSSTASRAVSIDREAYIELTRYQIWPRRDAQPTLKLF